MQNLKKIYVGCALQGVSEEFLTEIEQFRQSLESYGTVLRFAGIGNELSAQEVYEIDSKMAVEADIMVAICDIPSTGLGIEIAKRIERELPTLLAHQKGQKISRMVLGAATVHPTINLVTYETLADLVPSVAEYIRSQ